VDAAERAGVTGVSSFTSMMRTYSEGYNENTEDERRAIDPNY